MKTVFLPWFLQVIAVTLGYELKCPAPGHWRLRARQFYCGQSYVCLLQSPENSYRETCDGLDYSSTGSKLIFEPYFNKAGCSYKRYQPFPFSTDGNNKCVYQKSFCNEEGQIVHREGSMINDTTCGCDPSQGYIFVTTPKHNCYCTPSEEDCSCHKLICGNEANPCPYIGTAVRNKSCPEIIVKPSQPKNLSSPLENRFKDVRTDYNEGRNHKLNCIYFTVAVLIVFTIGLPLYGLSEWPDAFYKVRSFEWKVDHLNIIRKLKEEETAKIETRKLMETVLDGGEDLYEWIVDQLNIIKKLKEEEIAKIETRKLMKTLLDGGEDTYYQFLKALNSFDEYKDLAILIQETEITIEDRKNFLNCTERSK